MVRSYKRKWFYFGKVIFSSNRTIKRKRHLKWEYVTCKVIIGLKNSYKYIDSNYNSLSSKLYNKWCFVSKKTIQIRDMSSENFIWKVIICMKNSYKYIWFKLETYHFQSQIKSDILIIQVNDILSENLICKVIILENYLSYLRSRNFKSHNLQQKTF